MRWFRPKKSTNTPKDSALRWMKNVSPEYGLVHDLGHKTVDPVRIRYRENGAPQFHDGDALYKHKTVDPMFIKHKSDPNHHWNADKEWKKGYSAPVRKNMTNNIWHKEHSAVQDTDSKGAALSRFMEQVEGEVLTVKHSMTVKSSLLEIADAVKAVLEENGITATLKSDEPYWVGVDGGTRIAAIVGYDSRSRYEPSIDGISEDDDERANELFGLSQRLFTVTASGDRQILNLVLKALNTRFKDQRYAKLKWWYLGGHDVTYKIFYLEKPDTFLLPEFYPTIGDPQKFIKEYLASTASVLLLAGDPGTGKTTLLRHMIYEHGLTASVVYEEKIMERDSVFQNFLFDKENDVLIIEDADVILTNRTTDNNKLMSRFLNISDGLIKLPNKKLIFTTNVNDFDKVDPALMRPGRCFGRVHTRALTYDEAVKACKAASLPIPLEQREYTLAELFNQGRKVETRRIGFVGK